MITFTTYAINTAICLWLLYIVAEVIRLVVS